MEQSYHHAISLNDLGDNTYDKLIKIQVPQASKDTRWSHIENLDLFFSRLYTYHQKHGFYCILLQGILELEKVVFTMVFCVFLRYFIDYDILFRNKLPPHTNATNPLQKITLLDAVCSWNEGFRDISGLICLFIAVVSIYWLFRFIKLSYNLYHFWNIKEFYNVVLRIPDNHLCNITWHEIQNRICDAQMKHQMCIRKDKLTELDIYHRILRSKNYMVAMINKSILPTHYKIPLLGTIVYFSQGFKYNVEMLLFSGTWGLFDNWHLIEDYKKSSKRHELAAKLRSSIARFAFVNLILAIFIFIWQLVYFFFNYGELLKREPGTLALRCWSLYGRLYLRHFNELDHELDARLRRAYRPASKYMNAFSSPITVILAKDLRFQAGAIFIVLILISVYNENFLTVLYVVPIIGILGAFLTIVSNLIPDENCCFVPENLMMEVLSEVHYLPDSWRGQAHTTIIRDEFSQFFQYKAVCLMYELVSPIIVPFILYLRLRPKALEIIDFYRNFTVSMVGVGDVCSFSSMDMRKHGNALWQVPGQVKCLDSNKTTQAENGKTELSLLHFATMNPTWHPPQDAKRFILELQGKVTNADEMTYSCENDAHSDALSSVKAELNMIASQQPHQSSNHVSNIKFGSQGYLSEGPAMSTSYCYNTAFKSRSSVLGGEDLGKQVLVAGTAAMDMSLKALQLHLLHYKKLVDTPGQEDDHSQSTNQHSINYCETFAPSDDTRPARSAENVTEGTPLLTRLH